MPLSLRLFPQALGRWTAGMSRTFTLLGLWMLPAWGLPSLALAQTGSLRGQVVDRQTQEPLPGVNVALAGTTRGAATDPDGRFEIPDLAPGTYAVQATFLGYAPQTKTDIVVQPSRPTFILFELQEQTLELGDVVVAGSAFETESDAPTSVRVLGAEEVRRTPGGLNDISRSLLSLPGVVGTVDNRNDLLVRGGGPGENAYFLDGIQIPQINHFATQGATGGPLGLINVDFIRETEFFTGGFPARYGDALSSVLVVENRPGSPQGVAGDFTLGASEAGLTLDGPLGARGSWLLSARRSYLQFLFELLELPILPAYWDFQTRIEYDLDQKNRLRFVGLGAIDQFGIREPDDDDFEQQETADRVFDNDQWSYTNGLLWRHLFPDGYFTLALSRSMTAFSFADEDKETGETVFENTSQEAENRLRLDGDYRLREDVTLGFGGGVTLSRAAVDFFEAARPGTNVDLDLAFESTVALWRPFAYTQATWTLAGGRLTATGGLRYDGNTFLDEKHYLAPRLSASYQLSRAVALSASTGVFYQAPPYLALSVQVDGAFVNRALPYLRADHYVLGVGWQPRSSLRFTVEGYYKAYSHYPVSKADPRVSLANLGGDFGFIGAEPLEGVGDGRAYGLELFAQKKLVERFYGLAAYTLGWSEFAGKDGVLKPSSWDVRHTLSLTAGYRLGRSWEVGARWRFLSGYPYTPYDLERSAEEYAITGRGVLDYDRLNSERVPAYHRLDVRVDRRFFFSGWNAVIYLDIQNVYGRKNLFGYQYTEDPAYPDYLRPNEQIGFLPNIGFSVEW